MIALFLVLSLLLITNRVLVEACDDSAGLLAQRTWHAVFSIAYRDFVDEFHADLQAAR